VIVAGLSIKEVPSPLLGDPSVWTSADERIDVKPCKSLAVRKYAGNPYVRLENSLKKVKNPSQFK